MSMLDRLKIAYGDFTCTEFDDPFLEEHVKSVSLGDTDINGPDRKVRDLNDFISSIYTW